MKVINLTPHAVDIYSPEAFLDLQQIDARGWGASAVAGKPIVSFPSSGVAHISSCVKEASPLQLDEGVEVPLNNSVFLGLHGIPDDVKPGDILIVSMPTLMKAIEVNHPMATAMCCPDKVVRDINNTSRVLGCLALIQYRLSELEKALSDLRRSNSVAGVNDISTPPTIV
jgi:hypothetical protein